MPQYGLTSGLPTYPAGLEDKEAGLVLPLYRSINGVAVQLSSVTGNVQYDSTEMAVIDQFTKIGTQRLSKVIVQAGEALAFGNVVTLSLSSGRVVAYKADLTDVNKPAHAMIDVPAGLTTGQYGEAIFMVGRSLGVTGTGFMTQYWLSTAGQVQSGKPTTPGYLRQFIGYGLGSSGIYLDMQPAEVI